MNTFATLLTISAVLGAPTYTQELPRAADMAFASAAPEDAQLPRTPAPPVPPAAPPPGAGQPEERERTAPPPPPPGPPPPGERRPLPTRNVKVDVTITEQNGTEPPLKKMASVVVADGRQSSVRSMSIIPVVGDRDRDLPLNVDATVNLTPDSRVLLELRFHYSSVTIMKPLGSDNRPNPATEQERVKERDVTAPRASVAQITENLTALVTPGVPLVVARSADAGTDRTVTVEVKAEILK